MKHSNCCNYDIYIVGKQKYGICRSCYTRIGYHDEEDDSKYDPYNLGFEAGGIAMKKKIIKYMKTLDKNWGDKKFKQTYDFITKL